MSGSGREMLAREQQRRQTDEEHERREHMLHELEAIALDFQHEPEQIGYFLAERVRLRAGDLDRIEERLYSLGGVPLVARAFAAAGFIPAPDAMPAGATTQDWIAGSCTPVYDPTRTAGILEAIRADWGLAGRAGADSANTSSGAAHTAAASVRFKGEPDTDDARAIDEQTRLGLTGPARRLPHQQRIDESFGRHAVGEVEAHLDATSERAAASLGVEAFARDGRVAFRREPDVRTAAHEAAHVVQQRKGFTGQPAEAQERHADEVAERVVRGQSAEALFDSGTVPPPRPGSWADVHGQKRRELAADVRREWQEAAARIEARSSAAQVLATSVDATLQARGTLRDRSDRTRQRALAGVRGAARPLPFLDQIRRAFGERHELSSIEAHVGGAAEEACQAIGARAYAVGESVAFGRPPDLRTAAHEAAHVVQQRFGVQLPGGVGQANDRYERHADAVADAVARGSSAEALLDRFAPAGPPLAADHPAAVQRDPDFAALARRIRDSDDEDVIIPAFDELRRPSDYRLLLREWALISPHLTLLAHLREELDDDEFHEVEERIIGLGVAGSYGEMTGTTTESFYNLRAAPNTSGTVIGQLQGSSVSVRVVGKARDSDEEIWYLLEYLDQASYDAVSNLPDDAPQEARDLAASRRAWVIAAGVAPIVSWNSFIAQLSNFEALHYDITLQERITLLRQMAHPERLPFDTVVGTPEGDHYEDDRPERYNLFQLLMDAKAVRTPSGEVIDIYHVIVGLDAYQTGRRGRTPTVHGTPAGQSDASSTWAGDIGAGVTDAVLRNDTAYESANPGQAEAARREHYYRTRAPEADLLADIDAWGMVDEVEDPSNTSLVGILNAYYGIAAAQPDQFRNRRQAAVRRFIQQYGLTTTGGTLVTGPNARIIWTHISAFALIWFYNRRTSLLNPFPTPPATEIGHMTIDMGTRFLRWLDQLARSVGAI